MIKASIDLQDLRRRLYVKAKAEPSWRFWGLYVHVCKMETLRAAYEMAEKNDGAPGIDGVTFEAIEAQGVDAPRADTGRTDRAHLPTTPPAEAGDTEGRGQSPRRGHHASAEDYAESLWQEGRSSGRRGYSPNAKGNFRHQPSGPGG